MTRVLVIGCGLAGSAWRSNAPSGITEYCRNLGPMYFGLAREQADPREWGPDLVKQIEAERRRATSAEQRLGSQLVARPVPCCARVSQAQRTGEAGSIEAKLPPNAQYRRHSP